LLHKGEKHLILSRYHEGAQNMFIRSVRFKQSVTESNNYVVNYLQGAESFLRN